MSEQDGMNGLGDIIDNDLLRRMDPQWVHLGRRRWIIKPDWVPPKIQGLENVQQLIDKHLDPKMWIMLRDFYELQKRGTYRIQKPGWIEPPLTSEPEDRVSETGVALQNGTAVTVVSYTCPDRSYAVFKWFGHGLDVAAQFGIVSWTIQIDKRPYRTYNAFLQQRGTLVQPTLLARPITLKPKSVLEVTATGGAVAVNAFARIEGWSISAARIEDGGSGQGFQVR